MKEEATQLRLTLALFHCRGGNAPALSRALRQKGSLAALAATSTGEQMQYGLSVAQQALLGGEALGVETQALCDKDLAWASESRHY